LADAVRHESGAGVPEVAATRGSVEPPAVNSVEPSLADPRAVLSLLEADQVVAAKSQTHFGPRKFSVRLRILLWGLRIYVILMLVLVLISIFRLMLPIH
jgi:hypothetical protein